MATPASLTQTGFPVSDYVAPTPTYPTTANSNKNVAGTLSHGTDDSLLKATSIPICNADDAGYLNKTFPLLSNLNASSAPGVSNDHTEGYAIGSEWWDTTNHHFYKASSVATGAANWVTLG